MFLPACKFLALLLPTASRGLRQRPHRQGWCLLRRHRWPGFGDEVSQGPWGVCTPRHQAQGPPPANDTRQPQADGLPRPCWLGDKGHDVQDRAGRDRRVRLPPTLTSHQGAPAPARHRRATRGEGGPARPPVGALEALRIPARRPSHQAVLASGGRSVRRNQGA